MPEKQTERIDWRDYIESNTGEVSIVMVAQSLGLSIDAVMTFAAAAGRHGARYVGGTSRFLIWKEDAESLEASLQ